MRTITVRGTGTVTASPDRIEVTMELSVLNRDYAAAVSETDGRGTALLGAVEQAGFTPDALKTTSYRTDTEYRGERDAETGDYRQVFAGYRIRHGFVLSFPVDMERLGRLIDRITASGAEPELSIRFTVEDAEAVRKAALRAAAENARDKAEILAEASGVRLGELMSIQYDWAEVRLESATMMDAAYGAPRAKAAFSANIVPQDITFSDSAGFVWEIA